MVRPLGQVLQLCLLYTLDTPLRFTCLPCFCHFSHGQGSIPLGSLAGCTFYFTDKAPRLLTDTTKKIDTKRFQVAAVMGTSALGLPIRDCAESFNSSVPKCAKVSTIDVMKKTIFECLYLVQGLGTLDLRVKCPYVLTSPPLTDQVFTIFVQFFSISQKSRNSSRTTITRMSIDSWLQGVFTFHHRYVQSDPH